MLLRFVLASVLLFGGPASILAGGFAYVTNLSSNAVFVVDTASNTVVTSIPVGTHPEYIAITPDGKRAYVVNVADSTVSFIDTTANAVVATIAVGTNPELIAITPDGTRAYVTDANLNTVSVISTASNSVVATVPVGAVPYGVAITPDGTRAYVTNQNDTTVSVISTASNSVVATIALGPPSGNSLYGVAITPDGTRAYVENLSSNKVSVIDTASNTVVATIAVGGQPTGITITPDGSRAYVTNDADNTVSVIDTASNTVVATVPVGSHPQLVAVTPDGTRAYVANYNDGTISVISTASNTVVGVVGTGGPFGPVDIAFAALSATATGTINVSTNLPGATFTISGPATYIGSGTSFTQTNALAGAYTITFGAVAGYTTPSPQMQTLPLGGSISFSGIYLSATTGGINVTTNLAAAAFTITESTGTKQQYQGSGTSFTLPNAPAGTYKLTFQDVTQYISPGAQTLKLAAAGTITFNEGIYTPIALAACPTNSPLCYPNITFTYQQGSITQPQTQQISITSTGPKLDFSASASSSSSNCGTWLSVKPLSGKTPGTLAVSVQPNVMAGTCTGLITVTSPGAAINPQPLPVTLSVTPPASRQVTLTSITGWTSVKAVINAQWQGQPDVGSPGGPATPGNYYEYYVIDTCQAASPCLGKSKAKPSEQVMEKPSWTLNGSGFCPSAGCNHQKGSLTFSDASIDPVSSAAITSWTDTEIVFTPSFTDSCFVSVQSTECGASTVSVTITAPDDLSETLPLPSPGGGVVASIAGRGYGQCTWYVANQLLAQGLPIPVPAYYTIGEITTSYIPQQWDVVDFTNQHTAIIISPVTISTVPSNPMPGASYKTTYSFTIGEMNVFPPWGEAASTVPSSFVITTSATGVQEVTTGIHSQYNTTKTATAYFR